MRIRYVGTSGVRIIEPFEWNKENDFVQDVPDELAENLLTYPYPDWESAEEDPEAAKTELEKALTKPKKKSS